MNLLNRGTRKSFSMVGANGHLNELGRVRLTSDLFCGHYRPGQRVRLRAIAAKYGLDNDAVLKLFTEFQSLGLITLSGNFAAVLHSPNVKEMHEARRVSTTFGQVLTKFSEFLFFRRESSRQDRLESTIANPGDP